MIKAIRERGVQLKAEKIAKANSDLEKAKLKAIQKIEKELKDRELKIEDLEEEYHDYEEVINGLSKKFKTVFMKIKLWKLFAKSFKAGRFENEQGGKSEQLDKEKEESEQTILLLSDDKKIDREMKPVEYEKLQVKKLTDNIDYKIGKNKDKRQVQDFNSEKSADSGRYQFWRLVIY